MASISQGNISMCNENTTSDNCYKTIYMYIY